MRGSQNKKVGASKSYALSEQLGAADFRIRPLADKFLYRELVRVNAYKCAKFQVPSSISYRDIYVAIVPANACQHSKFQLSGLRA